MRCLQRLVPCSLLANLASLALFAGVLEAALCGAWVEVHAAASIAQPIQSGGMTLSWDFVDWAIAISQKFGAPREAFCKIGAQTPTGRGVSLHRCNGGTRAQSGAQGQGKCSRNK